MTIISENVAQLMEQMPKVVIGDSLLARFKGNLGFDECYFSDSLGSIGLKVVEGGVLGFGEWSYSGIDTVIEKLLAC